jgi:hypothetical protein
LVGLYDRFVDPNRFRERHRFRKAPLEPVWMHFVSSLQDLFPFFDNLLSPSAVSLLAGHQTDPHIHMVMLGVIPGKEGPAKAPGILYRTKPVRELRSILQRLELRFRVGIEKRDVEKRDVGSE